MTKPIRPHSRYSKDHNIELDIILHSPRKTGTPKPYKFVRYCIHCNKRFYARIASIKVCDACSMRDIQREMNKILI